MNRRARVGRVAVVVTLCGLVALYLCQRPIEDACPLRGASTDPTVELATGDEHIEVATAHVEQASVAEVDHDAPRLSRLSQADRTAPNRRGPAHEFITTRRVALTQAKRLAQAANQQWPDTSALSHAVAEEVVRAYMQRSSELADIDKVRMPIVKAIAKRKFDQGETEDMRFASSVPIDLEGSEKASWLADTQNQREPTKPRQTVVIRGSGNRMVLARVDADADYRLQTAYDLIDQTNERFLQRVMIALSTQGK